MNLKKISIGIIILITIFAIFSIFATLLLGHFALNIIDSVTKSIENQGTGDDFYKQSSGWDYSRIALVGRYQTIRINDGWQITYEQKTSIQGGANNIKKMNVKNGIIYAYAQDSIYQGTKYPQIWYVIIPDKAIEKNFLSEQEFSNYLDNGINSHELIDINTLYNQLQAHGYLDWYPDSYKKDSK